MSAIDRVMRAYASKHSLSPNQAAFVRAELSKFIDELMGGSGRVPTMPPDASSGEIRGGAVPVGSQGRPEFGIGDVRIRPDASSFQKICPASDR